MNCMKVVPIRETNAYAPTNEYVAKSVRDAAGWIEAGDYEQVDAVVMLIEHGDGQIARLTMGKSMDRARVAGLIAMAQHQLCHE